MFENIFKLFKKEDNSKDVAKERLKLVLIHDKANVSPEFLDMVKGEIIKVIKKYMEIDEESLDIQLTKTQSDAGDRIVPALVANIPILNVKSSAVQSANRVKAIDEDKEDKEEDVKEEKPAKKASGETKKTSSVKKVTKKA